VSHVRLSCGGIAAGPLWVPPFDLHLGESVCLHLPEYTDDAPLVAALKGLARGEEGGQPPRVVWGGLAWDDRPRIMRFFLPSPRAVDWLRRVAHVQHTEALAALKQVDLDPSWRLNRMAGNPRTWLGLAAAWAQSPDVLIFSTTGCDPLGQKRVIQAVARWLESGGAAVRLTDPYWTQGSLHTDCVPIPGCMCLKVEQHPAPAIH